MITTIYKCDKCGNTQKTPEQFWRVGVVVNIVTSKLYNVLYESSPHTMQVCRDCLEHFGIHPQKKTIESPTYNPPTLEDLIIEIVNNAIDER